MKKIIIYEDLNVGEYAYDKIKIEENYDKSDEYDYTDEYNYTDVVVNGEWWAHDLTTEAAIINAFEYDSGTAKWLLENLK